MHSRFKKVLMGSTAERYHLRGSVGSVRAAVKELTKCHLRKVRCGKCPLDNVGWVRSCKLLGCNFASIFLQVVGAFVRDEWAGGQGLVGGGKGRTMKVEDTYTIDGIICEGS